MLNSVLRILEAVEGKRRIYNRIARSSCNIKIISLGEREPIKLRYLNKNTTPTRSILKEAVRLIS